MKRQQSFGDDEGDNDRDKEKHSRLSNLKEIPKQNCNNSSPPCKENVNTTTFTASATALIQNINLKMENNNLKTALKDAAIEIKMNETEIENLKNKVKKEKELAEKFMRKSDEERVQERKRAIKAVAEMEKIKEKLSQTLSILKSKEAEILLLQNQITEMNKAENEKFNAEIKEWKDRVSRRDKELKDEKKRTDKAVSREKRYYRMMKAKEDRISELQILHKKGNDKFENLEKLENENVEYKSKNESLERLLKELLDTEKANKVKIATLQKELDSATEKLNNKKEPQNEQEILYESYKIELLEDQLTDAKKEIIKKDETIADLQKQMFGEKNDKIQNAGTSSKTYEYQISKLENACDSLRQKTEAIKQKANDDLKKARDEHESYERRLNEYLEAERKRNEEIATLQKELNSVTEELNSKKKAEIEKEKLYESYKAEIFENAKKMVLEKDETVSGLQTQIEERQQIIDEKDEYICKVYTQLNNQQKEIDLKNAEIQKVKTPLKTLEKEVLKLENKCDSLRQQIGAIKEKSKNDLKKADDEIEKLEIKLVDSMDECQQLNNSIEAEANEMFKEWKNREKLKKQNCNCIKKDNIIRELKEELAAEKELNETFMNASNASFINGPKWIVPIEVCQHMIDSNAHFMPFLQQYSNSLFTAAEILLPEDYCKEKFNELKAVISHFWKNEDDETKEMYYVQIKRILNNKRYNGRQKHYGKCDSLHSVAITSEGNSFFYSLKSINNDKIWQPYSDQSYKNNLEYKKISSSVPFSAAFGIPSSYSLSEYILIIQNSPTDGQKLIKMIPKIGTAELISRKLKTEK